MNVVQIVRHKNQRFFSIESVFENVRKAWPSQETPEVFMLPRSGLSVFNVIALIRLRLSSRRCIFHITGDVHYAGLFLPRRRTLLTIHDCVFVSSYSGLKGWVIRMLYLKMPVSYLKYLTAVSAKTKNEVVELTGCDAQKISVISNPVPASIRFVSKNFEKDCPTLLFIGTTPNKNLERVSAALKGVPCKLCIIGAIDGKQAQMLNAAGVDFVSRTGLTDVEMADMYAAADVILYPSLYEGFGLPLLEGFVSGRVIVTSNISPLKEIAGNAAIFVNPLDTESIRAGVLEAINNSELRGRLIGKGLAKAEKYRASVIAMDYLNLYQQIEADSIT